MTVLNRSQFVTLSRNQIIKAFSLKVAGEPNHTMTCPQCGESVKRKKLPKHVAQACTKRPLKIQVHELVIA